MSTFYSIIQYLPDPIIDERINVGVIVYGDGHIRTKFLKKWKRIEQFGNEDVSFLKDFATRLQKEQHSLYSVNIDENILKEMIGSWINCIQFTQPKPSLENADSLLSYLAKRFLHDDFAEASQKGRKGITRGKIINMATKALESHLKVRFGERARKFLKKKPTIAGYHDRHILDIGLGNKEICFVAEGLLLTPHKTQSLLREIDALKWSVDDIMKKTSDLPLAILMPPPEEVSDLYQNTVDVFMKLGADIVPTDKIDEMAEKAAKIVEAQAS